MMRSTVVANNMPNLSMRMVKVRSRGGVCRIDQFINMQGVSVHMVNVTRRERVVGSHMKRVKAGGARIIAQNLEVISAPQADVLGFKLSGQSREE